MAFNRIEEMDEEDFLMDLKNNPKELRIIEVKDLKESESGEGGYFYCSFENPESFQSFDIGYNVRMNDDGSLFVGSKSKLYPILSNVTGIYDGAIRCDDFSDIKEALEGFTFKASWRSEKFGTKSYFIIVPIADEGEEIWFYLGNGLEMRP